MLWSIKENANQYSRMWFVFPYLWVISTSQDVARLLKPNDSCTSSSSDSPRRVPNLELVAVKCQRLTSWHLTSHHRNTVSLVHRHVVALLCLDPLGFTAARVLVLNKEVETPTRVTFCIKTVAWIKVHYVEKAKERHSPRPSTHNTTDDSAINLLCCIYEL